MLLVNCKCGQRLQVPSNLAGKRIKCPKCGERFATEDDVSEWIGNGPSQTKPNVTELPGVVPEWIQEGERIRARQQAQQERELLEIQKLQKLQERVALQPLILDCPNCGSENTQKVSAICEAGTTISKGRTGNIGGIIGKNSSGHLSIAPIIAAGTSHGVQTTNLASRLAPPQPPKSSIDFFQGVMVVVGIAIVGTTAGLASNSESVPVKYLIWISGILLTCGLITVAVIVCRQIMAEDTKAKETHNESLARWNETYYCHRCGESFIPRRASVL
jgi:predicted RNA-binding Zn-ribbon protein involved in translation (DUF1610 family)